MASLSQHFSASARRQFEFLRSEFGFAGPEVRQMGWQATTVYYVKDSVAVAISLDMEESTLVTFELWEGSARAEPVGDDRRRFSITALARFRDPTWPLLDQAGPLTKKGIDAALADEAGALRAHGADVISGRIDRLQPFVEAHAKWLKGRRNTPFPPS